MAPTPRKSFYPHIPESVRRPIAIALWIIFVIAVVFAWLIPLLIAMFIWNLLQYELGWPDTFDLLVGWVLGMAYGVLTVWFIAGRWLQRDEPGE